MGTTALVTGSPRAVTAVSGTAINLGIEVTGVHDVHRLCEVCTRLGFEAMDCYIQLPVNADIGVGGRTVVDDVRHFHANGVPTRFAAAVTVLPILRSGATVLLVAEYEGEAGIPDDARALLALLDILAQALLADTAKSGVQVTVLPAGPSPEDL